MSVSSSRYARRRLSLLASSSLVAATLMAGVGGVATLAPTAAMAADECGNPSGNAGAPDVFLCPAVNPTGIDYTTTTNGDLGLVFADLTTVAAGGVRITGNAGENLSVQTVDVIADAGDVHITNLAGYAVDLQASGGGSVSVDLRSNDSGDAASTLNGGRGIRASTSGAGSTSEVLMTDGSINVTAGFGVLAQSGSGGTTVDLGSTTVTSTGTGVNALSTGGTVDVTGSGLIQSSAGFGVFANGTLGSTVDVGDVTSTVSAGISATSSGGNVLVQSGNVTGVGGIVASAAGTHTATVITFGDVDGTTGTGITVTTAQGQATVDSTLFLATGTVGISMTATGNGGINLDATDVTGTAGSAIVTTTNGSGLTTIDVDGAVNATGGNGITAGANASGDIEVTLSSTATINATGAGIFALGNTGDVTVDGDGAITAAGGYGIYANTNTGSVVVNTAAGSTIDADNGYGIAAGVFGAGGGSVTVTADGDVGGLGNAVGSDGVVGVIFSAGNSSDINVTTNGNVYADGTGILGAAVGGRTSGTGSVTVTANGSAISTGNYGVVAAVNNAAGTGNATATVGANQAASGGIYGVVAANSGSGDATATAGAGSIVNGGFGGVLAAANSGDAAANADDNSDVIGGSFGVTATSVTGAASSTIGNNVVIDPSDTGVADDSGASDATTTIGNNVTIDINNTDADAIAYGTYTRSGAAADTGVGDPSVEVTAGTNLVITVDDGVGGEADGGIGVYALQNGGGTGSVNVQIGDLFGISVTGDNVAGVLGMTTGAGDVDITLGNGTITLAGGNGVDSAGTLPGSGGVAGISQGGNVTIETNGTTITVANGTLGAAGVFGSTTGTGDVDLTTNGGPGIVIGVTNGDGVNAEVVDGDARVHVNNDITVTGGDGIHVEASGVGTIDGSNATFSTITVTNGDGANLQTTTGVISFGLNGTTNVTNGDGINANASGAGVVNVGNGGAITITTAGTGILAFSNGGQVSVSNTGTIAAVDAGINAQTNGTGTVSVQAQTGGLISSTNSWGVNALTTGTGGVDVDTGAVTAAATGIRAISGGGNVTVDNYGLVQSSSLHGIDAETNAGGSVIVTTHADVQGNGGFGILTSTVDGLNSVTTGGSVSGLFFGISSQTTGSGNIVIDANALVTGANTGGILGLSNGGTGNVTITAGSVTSTNGFGVTAGINSVASAGNASVTIDDGSTITAATVGLQATTFGTGNATVAVGNNVTIDPNDYGVLVVSVGGDATATGGNNVVIDINNTDGDATSIGIAASSGRAADAGVGDPAVDVSYGTGLTITVDDGAGVPGDADGSAGIAAEAFGGSGSVRVQVGDGLDIQILGNNSVGIGAESILGNIDITTGTGSISIVAGDNTDTAGNYPGGAGIGARSTTGSITITNGSSIFINNNSLPTAGIHAETGGSGAVTVTTTGQVLSGGIGIDTIAVNGDTVVNQNAFVGTALGVDIQSVSSGTGAVTINANASMGSTADDGISVTKSGTSGLVTINLAAGQTITAGDDGVSAFVTNGASSSSIVVNANGAIDPNQSSGAGYGMFLGNAGSGDITVNFNATASIDGDAVRGISASSSGTGGIGIFSTGAIGTSGDVIDNIGINASITNPASAGGINIQSTGAFGIYAGNIGINAVNDGTGSTQVFTSGGSTVTVTGAGAIGINAVSTGGLVQVANNTAITATAGAGSVGINASNTNGTLSVGTSGAVNSSDDAIRTSNTGTATSTVFTVAGGALNASAGDGMDVSGVDGLLDIDTADNVTGGLNGILAVNSGTGAITVDTTVASAVAGNGGDGIHAQSAGGAVTVTTNGTTQGSADGIEASSTAATVIVTNNGTVQGGTNGILTGNTGAGVTTLNVNANVTATGAGNSALNAVTTGTGTVTVSIANNRTITDTVGSAVRTTSAGGTVNITTGTGTTLIGGGAGATSWVVDLNNAAGGTTNFTVGANSVVRSTDNTTTGYDDLAIRGIGGSVVVNNGGRIQGRVNFSGLTGNVVFNNTSTTSWHTTGASVFSPGADTLNNTGIIFTNAGAAATSFDFGGGSDVFANSGELIVGEPAQGAATLTITNLETWNNSGRIVFGSSGTSLTAASDGFNNDRIFAAGTTFNGTGSSRLVMDANLGATVQTSCATLTAADCFSLTGGTTTGSTLILVTDNSPNAFGAFNPGGIVLVDVAGGTTSATNFSLDPNSSHWRADPSSPDGVLDKGLFMYDLILDPATKQHELVGVPDGEAFQFTTLGQAAQAVWYQTTGTWSDRQADVRDQAGDITEGGYGVWMRITGGAADRDLTSTFSLKGTTWTFDTSYSQNTSGLFAGVDFVAPTSGGIWLLGGMVGYVDSDVTFDASPTVASMEGYDIGGYATYLSDGLFINAIVNLNNLDLSWQAPTLAPAGSNIFRSQLKSLGGQVEAGKTFALGGSGFFEPLASLSYVKTDIDDVNVPGAAIDWDDQTSFRGSLGARIGLNSSMDTFNAKFALTGRIWDEFEGDNRLVIHSGGPDLPLGDDFSGTFGEIQGSVNLFSTVNAFSAFATIGAKFKDDYQSTEGSLGFRWRW